MQKAKQNKTPPPSLAASAPTSRKAELSYGLPSSSHGIRQKNPDSKISRLGAGKEADRSQAHPAGIASVESEIRFPSAYISCQRTDQWSSASLQQAVS